MYQIPGGAKKIITLIFLVIWGEIPTHFIYVLISAPISNAIISCLQYVLKD